MLIFKSYVIYITFLYLYKSLCSILWNRLNRSFDFDPCSHVGNNTDRKTIITCHSYFNPRSCVGNDTAEIKQRLNPYGSISIHVPAWGTTANPYRWIQPTPYFNPRSRVGNDIMGWNGADIEAISIHVPAWGTTGEFYPIITDFRISIHVPAWGTTATDPPDEVAQPAFQSTFPRGERLRYPNISLPLFLFQSTFPRGERLRTT